MVAAKTVGLLVLLTVGLTLGIGGIVGSQYAQDQLDEGIEEGVATPVSGEDDYDSFVSNVDSEIPTFRKYYFWNMTNMDEYLTGAEPVYEEVGPYAYQQFNIKFGIGFNGDNSEVSYQTYTYYVFNEAESFSGASADDTIVNINPAYLGVIGGAGSEFNLVTGFVGPAVQSIVEGLTGDFTDGVLYQGAAQALDGIEAEAVEEFEFAVNATTAAGLLFQVHSGVVGATNIDTANNALFNDVDFQGNFGTPIEGVSEAMTGGLLNLGYTNDTIRAFLHDGPTGLPGFPAIFDDLATGTGVLGFLQLYNNATNELGGLNNATLQAMYAGASQTQLDAFAGYLAQYLIDDNAVVAGAYLTATSGTQNTQEAAYTNLYSQWVNATFIPEGLDINGDGFDDDGFEIALAPGFGIDNATVAQLFDASNPLALTNAEQGIFTWLLAAAGNTTLQGLLASTYTNINATEFGAIYLWLSEFTDFTTGLGTNLALGQIAVNSGYAPGEITASNLGYLHWAQPTVTGGITLDLLTDGLPGSVELWDNSAVDDMNVSNVMALLFDDGTTLNLQTTDGVGYLLQNAALLGSDPATAQASINAAFGAQLTLAEIGAVATYIGYLQQVFVLQATLQPILDAGGGLVTARSINDWLFEGQDPLLQFLVANGAADNADANLFTNATSMSDPRIADASTYKTGRNDISEVNQFVEWQGNTELDVWVTTEIISGTDGTQFAPGVSSDDTLTAFISDLLRVIDFAYDSDLDVKGIEALKFVLPDAVLGTDANYYQSIAGLANMTSSAGIPLFLSKPHFLDADSSLLDDVTGLSPVAADHDTYLGVEPLTGAVIDARKRLQVNLEVGTGNYITTSVSGAIMPVLWIEDGGTIPDDSAEDFIDVIYGAVDTIGLLRTGGLVVGSVVSLAAIYLLVRPKV